MGKFVSLLLLAAALAMATGQDVGYGNDAGGDEHFSYNFQDIDGGKGILLHVTAQTTGWVGFGLSKDLNVQMEGADMVIGGVYENGTAYYWDYTGKSSSPPKKDKVNNWKISTAMQNGTYTDLRYTRPYHSEGGIDITTGEVRIIWAYGSKDFTDASPQSVDYHGQNNKNGVLVTISMNSPIKGTSKTITPMAEKKDSMGSGSAKIMSLVMVMTALFSAPFYSSFKSIIV